MTISTAGAAQLTRLLHRDAVASVYYGYLSGRNTPVVVTLAHSRVDGSRREVFLDWAAKVTHLSSHPHIAPIVAIGLTETARPYIAVHATRTTLADTLRENGPPPAGQVRALGVALADTLAVIHKTGLIHGALQPATVLSGTGKKLLVTGFDATAPVLAHPLPVGPYTAPEHLEASAAGTVCASPAADVYDLATLLYAALGGRLPWLTSHRADLANPLLRAAPIPDIAGVSIALTDVLGQAMHIDPHERPDASTLSELLSHVDVTGPLAPGSRRRTVSVDLVPRCGPRPTPLPVSADIAVTKPAESRSKKRRMWHPAATAVTTGVLGFVAIGGAGLATFFATTADAFPACPTADTIISTIETEYPVKNLIDYTCDGKYVAAKFSTAPITETSINNTEAERWVILHVTDDEWQLLHDCPDKLPSQLRQYGACK